MTTTTYTKEQIEKLPVNELRKLFRGSNVKFERDGKSVSISNTRKDELVKQALELLIHDEPEPEVDDDEYDATELMPIEKLIWYTKLELLKLAKNYLFNVQSIPVTVMKLATHTFINLRGMRTEDGRLLSNSYLLQRRSTLLKSLKVDTDNLDLKSSFEVVLNLYQTQLKTLFYVNDITYLKQNSEYKLDINKRQHDINLVNALPVVKWACETLQTGLVDNPTPSQFNDVVLALIVVTGRRTAEVIHSGRFEYHDKFSVKFSGQLKTKHCESVSYVIPTLVDSHLVIKAHTWLLSYENKVSKLELVESKSVNRYYSTGLSRKCHDINGLLVSVDGSPITDENGDEKIVTPHRLRELYAQICYKVFCKEGSMRDVIYIGQILGHVAESYGRITDTANSYNSYYSVMDYQDIIDYLHV